MISQISLNSHFQHNEGLEMRNSNMLLQPQHPRMDGGTSWSKTDFDRDTAIISQISLNSRFEHNGGFEIRNSNPLLKPLIDIEDARVVRRLVNNLMYLFGIEPGDHITFILGHGECSSNNEALQTWVLEELSDSVICPDDVLGELVSRLKEQLMMEVYS